jgi:hypothetical protein
MVFRISLVSGVVGSDDGPLGIRYALDVLTTPPVYCGLLWVHSPYFIFQSRGKFHPQRADISSVANSKHEQLQSTILTLISALIQLACLAWYLVSYFPMGSSG